MSMYEPIKIDANSQELIRGFAEFRPYEKIVSHDEQISTVMKSLPLNQPVKIILSGKTSILIDEEAYNGLLETLHILQENPSIVKSLAERERGEFIDERDIHNYV